MLYTIGEAHSDYDMTPVEFQISTSEKWFRRYLRPPYHIPATLGHVMKHYDCSYDDLYLHAPRGVDYIMSEGKYDLSTTRMVSLRSGIQRSDRGW